MPRYATVADVRAEGLTAAEADDARVEALLDLVSAYIERVTGVWFDRRVGLTMRLDGSGSPVLELPQPPVTVTEVRVDGAVLAADRYVIRNRPETDDRWYPRLELVSGPVTRLERARLGGTAWRPVWPRGEQNIEVVGDWGFVEADGSTPPLIRRAAVLLVLGLGRPAWSGRAERRGARIRSETLGQYSYTLDALAGGANLTGDPEVDAILLHYRRPAVVVAG